MSRSLRPEGDWALQTLCASSSRITGAVKPVGRLIGFLDGEWRIGVDTHLSASQASRTLWHELMHALQSHEASGLSEFDARVAQELRTAGLRGRNQRRFARGRAYNRIPTELEANRARGPSVAPTSAAGGEALKRGKVGEHTTIAFVSDRPRIRLFLWRHPVVVLVADLGKSIKRR